ncbi:MAG: hypothetical protein U1D30_01345 [Planctomycetota bacterium]
MNDDGEIPHSMPRNTGASSPHRLPPSVGRKLTFIGLSISMGLIFAAVLSELALRVVDWPVPGLDTGGAVADWKVKVTGREGGTYPPGTWRLRHYDFDVEWVANSDGFHERERVPKKEGVYRIGLLGDSFTAGYGVAMDKRFSQIWFNQFADQNPNTEVWNLSTGLCGTAHLADVMAGVGKEYGFDEVILSFYPGNDLTDNQAWIRAEETGLTPSTHDDANGLIPTLRRNSRLLTFLWSHGLRSLKSYPPKGVFREAEFKELWPPTEISLDRFRENTKGLPMTIWYLPTEAEYSDSFWKPQAEKFQYLEADRHRARESLAKWAKLNAVEFVDLTPSLKGQIPAEIHFKNDAHWNELGNLWIGNALAKLPRATARGRQLSDH